MKRILSKTAFTLVELIIASLLVVIVLLGIFSINMVLSNNNQDYGQRYLVRSETQTTLNHILNNASLAVGSANANDKGILIGAAVGDPNSFCIHQSANNNVINFASDIWLCYSWAANQIQWCAVSYPAAAVTNPGSVPDPRGASSCSAAIAAHTILGAAGGNQETFLGTAFSITSTSGTNLPSSPYLASSITQLLFSINILNCLNDAAATCKPSGTSSDPANNPEVQLSGSVIPLQEST